MNSITLDKEMVSRNYTKRVHSAQHIVSGCPGRPVSLLVPRRLGTLEGPLLLVPFRTLAIVCCSKGDGNTIQRNVCLVIRPPKT